MGQLDAFRSSAMQQLDQAETALQTWIEEGVAHKEALNQAFAKETHNNSPEVLASLTSYIEGVEAVAQKDAEFGERLDKAYGRQEQEAAKLSSRHRDVVREIADREAEILRKQIEEKLNFALFLRALRAELNPDARGGPVFKGGKGIREHLEKALAA